MATKPVKPAAVEEAAAAPKKSKKLLIFIIIGIVVLALILGGASLLLLKKNKKTTDATEDEEEVEPAKAQVDKSHPPVFVPLEPFTVNLQPENGEQYLQVVLSFRMTDAKTGEEIKAFIPEIRHRILMLLSDKKASEIASTEGRETLADEIRTQTNSVLGHESSPTKKKRKGREDDPGGPVIAVFFTSFIIQ